MIDKYWVCEVRVTHLIDKYWVCEVCVTHLIDKYWVCEVRVTHLIDKYWVCEVRVTHLIDKYWVCEVRVTHLSIMNYLATFEILLDLFYLLQFTFNASRRAVKNVGGLGPFITSALRM